MPDPEEILFGEFQEHCPLSIVQFERRHPPEPDILCWLDDGFEIAYEITETIDSDLAQVQSVDYKTSQWLGGRAQSEDLPGLKHGALIAVNFLKGTTLNARQRQTAKLFDELRRIPADFVGQWHVKDKDLRSVVRRIGIGRGSWDTVEFQVPAVAAIRDPIVEQIQKKAANKYRTHAPIHLLVYYDMQPCLFDGGLSCPDPFECIWVFDRRSKQTWSFPARD